MRRTTSLTAAALLCVTLLAPASGTGATAPVICGGLPATVVGTTPTLTGTEGRDVIVTGSSTDVHALGGNDLVCVSGGGAASVVRLDAGAGDDDVLLADVEVAAGSHLDAGSGEDQVVAARSTGSLMLDLRYLEQLQVDDQPVASVAGVENAFLLAPEVVVIGDDADNDLFFHGCTASLIGLHGDDYLSVVAGDPWFDEYEFDCRDRAELFGGQGRDHLRGGTSADGLHGDDGRDRIEGRSGHDALYGGPGSDVLSGGEGRDRVRGDEGRDVLRGDGAADRLLGGPGRDRADGAAGHDRCVAERERRCER